MPSFEIRPIGAAIIVHVRGDLDATSAGALRSALAEAAEAGEPLLLVDMADVDFLDSAGLAVLVGVARTLRPDRRLALYDVPPRMQRMLSVAGINQVLQIHKAGDVWPFPDVPAPAGIDSRPPVPAPDKIT